MTAAAARPAALSSATVKLAPVAAMSDPIGVLSIYADANPALAAGPRPAWRTPVQAGLHRLVAEAQRARPRGEWKTLRRRLEGLEPELEALLDRRVGQRGRALFASVSGSELHRVQLRTPLAPLVALDRHARVLPLLAAMQDGAPAGVATVSWNRLELGEWAFDALRSLAVFDLVEPDVREVRPATNPAVPQPFPERDRFESAAGARVVARLRDAAAHLERHARTRGWDILIVDGNPRLGDALSDGLRNGPCRLVRSPQPIAGLPDLAAAERVGAILRELRAERRQELLRALDAPSGSTRDPLVLARSLEQGRVEHLILAVPSTPSSVPSAESLLRRALETGADVTVVSPESARLGSASAAALLRW